MFNYDSVSCNFFAKVPSFSMPDPCHLNCVELYWMARQAGAEQPGIGVLAETARTRITAILNPSKPKRNRPHNPLRLYGGPRCRTEKGTAFLQTMQPRGQSGQSSSGNRAAKVVCVCVCSNAASVIRGDRSKIYLAPSHVFSAEKGR
eukprot:1936449-Amphidinium_carterae.1